ncbi:hypothetical protein AK812_SmicGene36740 [Symbiodinium microadriaticum]|uniref:Uncharacterized protein n=1 Tax=Symbiodinium microadriaticum TaxID=2951 RepID=A0A1Q9CI36_SYMMI|nr:hypothetical protein AK812_SmicGene36740 [Symbiodinium microadriaticum]
MLQSSLDTHSETGSQEAARIDADEQEALRRRGNFKIWYRRRLTIIIFELALEKAFQQECSSSRQVAGKLSSFRRRCQGHDTEGIMYLALPQLNSEVGASARRDYELLQSLYEAPMPPNDETWIYSAMVGRHQDPGRQQVEHRLQLLLLRSLGARLQTATPEFLYRALLNASGGLYRDFLWVVWPLLTDEDRRDFQQWYYSGSDEPPARPTDETAALRMAVEEHESDSPEPARGSRDPAPGSGQSVDKQDGPSSLFQTARCDPKAQVLLIPNRNLDPAARPPKFQEEDRFMKWLTRPLQLTVLDQGTLWPLTVNTPLAARHALLAEPMWLPLQVSRFDARGRKTFDSVQISSAVYLPRFVDNTLHTTSTRYHITAVIFHLGDSPQRGHYRTAFYKDGRIVGMTDDNVQPIPASDADVELVQRNCYIFILRKC